MAKLTKSKLELQEKQLELQERRALLKENRQKLEIEKTSSNLEKAEQIRLALEGIYLYEDSPDPTYTALFQKKEFDILVEKLFDILKNL